MPNTHSTLTSLFTDIADAIRAKTNSNSTIVADDFPTAISNISGGGMQLVQHLYDHSYKFSDTNFASWTPSTTSATMVAKGTTPLYELSASNLTDAVYILRCKLDANYEYQAGTTIGAGMMLRDISVIDYVFNLNPFLMRSQSADVIANLDDGTLSYVTPSVADDSARRSVMEYYTSDTSGSIRGLYQTGTIYGVFFYSSDAPYSKTGSGSNLKYNFYSPRLDMQCNGTYFSTTYASHLDLTASTVDVSVDLFRSTSDRVASATADIVDVWQNGITITAS